MAGIWWNVTLSVRCSGSCRRCNLVPTIISSWATTAPAPCSGRSPRTPSWAKRCSDSPRASGGAHCPTPADALRFRDMATIGKRNTLSIVRESTPGLYLNGGELGEILLPRRYIPRDLQQGDKLDVFI